MQSHVHGPAGPCGHGSQTGMDLAIVHVAIVDAARLKRMPSASERGWKAGTCSCMYLRPFRGTLSEEICRMRLSRTIRWMYSHRSRVASLRERARTSRYRRAVLSHLDAPRRRPIMLLSLKAISVGFRTLPSMRKMYK